MPTKTLFTSLLASSAIALAVAAPAHADKKDRAQEAIAAAEAKLHTAESIGAGVETPRATAEARASLMRAKENLASGHKSVAIDEAIHASALADTAVGELQKRKDASIVAAREREQESVAAAQAAAQETAAAAQDRADAATQQAQQQTSEANARAAAAEQAAASSAADAAAARNAATLAATQQPTQVETTVSTQSRGAVVHRSSKVVTKPKPATTTTRVVPATTDVTTTTTVTPAPR